MINFLVLKSSVVAGDENKHSSFDTLNVEQFDFLPILTYKVYHHCVILTNSTLISYKTKLSYYKIMQIKIPLFVNVSIYYRLLFYVTSLFILSSYFHGVWSLWMDFFLFYPPVFFL